MQFIDVSALRESLVTYLDSVTGERPALRPMAVSALPLFLRERYACYEVRLFGRDYVLAMEGRDWDAGSPAQYETQSRALAAKLGRDVILVLRALSPYSRRRLIRLNIPFIVPESQLFLPLVMIDLRERYAAADNTSGKRLSPTAQLIVISHLLHRIEDDLSLQKIAEKLGCSPMMVTKAKDELEAAGLCDTGRQGRSVVLIFRAQGKVLWHKALPLLASPVLKTCWLRWEHPGYPALLAGITALSQKTMLADDPLPTYALDRESFRANLEGGLYRGCPGPEEATVRMEAWRYNPLLLGAEGVKAKTSRYLESIGSHPKPQTISTTVDPLSLYLSLRDNNDERVQQQLEHLMESVPW